ncbi:MAG: MerR family transcriptional regulator [Fibrobacteria bacterium]|nr:MerR family transcriptional regulator [Fibrobacteria bacterium]
MAQELHPEYFTLGQVAKKLRLPLSTLKTHIRNNPKLVPERKNHLGWHLLTLEDITALKPHFTPTKRKYRR